MHIHRFLNDLYYNQFRTSVAGTEHPAFVCKDSIPDSATELL